MVPQDFDLWVVEQAVLQDLLGAQLVAAMDQRDLRGEVGQEQRLFDRGVAAADHHDLLAAIEEPVAGGAGRDAEALEMLFAGQTQPFRLRPGGQDHGIGGVDRAAVGLRGEGAFRQVDGDDDVGDDLGADGLGMCFHPDHQVRALNLGVAGPVLDLRGDRQLAAGLDALDQDRFQHGAAGIDAGGIAGRARADDQDLAVTCLGHCCLR